MSKYTVARPCKIGGVIHKPGKAPIEVADKDAKQLVKSGALELLADPAAAENATKALIAKPAAEIIAALGELDLKPLGKLLAAERTGDKRKDVLEAIAAEFKKREKAQ